MPRHYAENPCCVCGKWGVHFSTLDQTKLSPIVVRKYVCGLLDQKYVCGFCIAKCSSCHCSVIHQQCRLFNQKCVQCLKDFTKSKNTYKRR